MTSKLTAAELQDIAGRIGLDLDQPDLDILDDLTSIARTNEEAADLLDRLSEGREGTLHGCESLSFLTMQLRRG